MSQPTVAVVGASSDRSKFGNKSVRAHQAAGYTVFPIHPTSDPIEGLVVYRNLEELPVSRLNRVTMYVRPQIGLGLLEQIAAKGCDELWLNPGTDSPELVQRARALGLNPIQDCSIVDLGFSPAAFPG